MGIEAALFPSQVCNKIEARFDISISCKNIEQEMSEVLMKW